MTLSTSFIKATLIRATLADYPLIQNMARFYVYDLSRYCGLTSKEWACPEDGLYENFDFKTYFTAEDRQAFLIKVDDELAGFVLINKVGTTPEIDWNMGEFFILARFQGKGVGQQIGRQILDAFPGQWEIAALPDNRPALAFWRALVADYTQNSFTEALKTITEPEPHPMVVLQFQAKQDKKSETVITVRDAKEEDIAAMVALSEIKRRDYEQAQPQFWQRAKDANHHQAAWFKQLLRSDDSLLFVAERDQQMLGFVIGRLVPAPEVYNLGGLTLMVDDFCVMMPSLWSEIGSALLTALKKAGQPQGAVQLLVVCGHHDTPKRAFLTYAGLTVASQWFISSLA
jgi:predicted acetyltransferase